MSSNQYPEIAPKELLQDLKKLQPLFAENPRVLGVFLFGSQVDGYVTSHSDVDMAVLYDGEVNWREHVRLAEAIAKQLGRKVDLANARHLPLLLQNRVIRGPIIYEKDPDRVSDFIQQVLVRYFDYQPRVESYYHDFEQAMEAAYGYR